MFGNVFGGDHHHPDWLTTGYDPSPAARSALWPGATPPRLPSRSDSHGVPESDIRTIYCTHSDNLRPQKSLTWLRRRQILSQGCAVADSARGHTWNELRVSLSLEPTRASGLRSILQHARFLPHTTDKGRQGGMLFLPCGAVSALQRTKSSECTASRPARRHNHR